MSKVEHTPIPWIVKPDMGNLDIVSGDVVVAEITALMGVDEGDHANADFIVKAVNCHDELVAACKESLEIIKALMGPTTVAISTASIQAILAKAKEGRT